MTFLTLLVLVGAVPATAADAVMHRLRVFLDPVSRQLRAEDSILLPNAYLAEHPTLISFVLDARLKPVHVAADGTLKTLRPLDTLGAYGHFYITLPPRSQSFDLRYGGVLPAQHGAPGQGMVLRRDDFWYPVIGNDLVTFSLQLALPPGWSGLSQGRRVERKEDGDAEALTEWRTDRPQEQIWLVADRFHEYTRKVGGLDLYAYLLNPEPATAAQYLDAAQRYLELYGRLIGPYPHEKFALVESVEPMGYARPSFALIGSPVLRMPRFIDTGYPHEILHNWFGNGVFPDFEGGNWSEGLVSYLSDHLFAEQRGEGVRFRREALWNYRHYAGGFGELPLREFRVRHDSTSEGVGYHKAMMLFHTLRRLVGDAAFLTGLRDFQVRHRFRIAGWDDLRLAFERASGRDLAALFAWWVDRTGAPTLALREVTVRRQGDAYRVSGVLLQEPESAAAPLLRVPVAITHDGGGEALLDSVEFAGARQEFAFTLPFRPLLLEIDPDFDVFRRLGEEETPPALGDALDAGQLTLVTPMTPTPELREGIERFVAALGERIPRIRVVAEDELERLPTSGAVVLVGWENRHLAEFAAAVGAEAQFGRQRVSLPGGTFARDSASLVLAARRTGPGGAQPLLWVACDCLPAMRALAARLLQYAPHGFLVFRDAEPEVLTGAWTPRATPLRVDLTGGGAPPAAGRRPPAPALTDASGGP